jgi:CRISPR-associated protein Cas7/Cst2/DevR subtype I-B
MSLHLFGTVLTTRAIAANNRGENDGSATTLQKVIRDGDLYSTVSAEAIRYALREAWLEDDEAVLNRRVSHNGNEWQDKNFGRGWEKYIDNDVLGFMNAKEETVSRRGVLEVSRAVSMTPWPGTLSANFASPGSNPGVTHDYPIPYQAEMHDTRYQYTFALTPNAMEGALPADMETRLTDKQRTEWREAEGQLENTERLLKQAKQELKKLTEEKKKGAKKNNSEIILPEEDQPESGARSKKPGKKKGEKSELDQQIERQKQLVDDQTARMKALEIELQQLERPLRVPSILKRVTQTLRAIQNLRRVGGNHGRFLYDFSPEVMVLRVTEDPAPRVMLCFDENDRGEMSLAKLVARMQGDEKDVEPVEIVVGTVLPTIFGLEELRDLKVEIKPGVKAAVSAALEKLAGRIT